MMNTCKAEKESVACPADKQKYRVISTCQLRSKVWVTNQLCEMYRQIVQLTLNPWLVNASLHCVPRLN